MQDAQRPKALLTAGVTERFTDRSGFAWQVCELSAARESTTASDLADMPPASRGWLYFFSRGTTLVLRDYPDNWDTLSWAELERLRERAMVLGSDTEIRLPAIERRRAPRHVQP